MTTRADADDWESACTRLCTDFAWAVDSRDYGHFVSLFAEDGVFDRAGQVSHGHAGILAFLEARPADLVTRHLCANIQVDLVGAGHATGRSYALVYRASGGTGDIAAPPVPTPLMVEYHDEFRRTPAGWKFARRCMKPVLQ